MAINTDYIGRTFEPSEPYEVSRVKIAEFADAIGEPSELCRDKAAAQRAGYPDVIAPPTLAIVIAMASTASMHSEPGLGLDYSMVVHGEQRFEYSRPIHAGDVVTTQSTITEIKDAGRNALVTAATEIRTVGGEHVCTAHNTLVDRGGAA